MPEKILILGYGPIGQAIVQQLAAAGRTSTIVQRRRPENLPEGAVFEACDALDGPALRRVVQGASAVVCTIGLAYDSAVWEKSWPRLMTNMLDACEAAGARLVFIDNVYMYGPQDAPLTEDLPMAATGRKGKVRAAITRQWQASYKAGRVRTAALRAPDFYGPGTTLSIFGDATIGALAKGRTAQLVVAPDAPHALAYVPDIARAAILLLDAPDDAYGQIWHAPCAPARAPRELLGMAASRLGVGLRLMALPGWLMPLLGLFMPFLREWHETYFQHDRPFRVDSRKFEQRFGVQPTPLEEGIEATAESFRRPH
ncbi:NAD-dependent epimerase/dehydratase family protein [Labrys monachus]|uniref:Nucleoside-diphosphate-sugar epimerase n=1 Tax=Labrys monachus TaxID=217067 RepID=A0ABU0FDD6_9HYPH|nr:NAD-dependent epimerase/dehydratase family protein [Labrys monachus]MDQ0392148.1 nucleoside-diphosphate-sugar epimerase [Labrys monachus]